MTSIKAIALLLLPLLSSLVAAVPILETRNDKSTAANASLIAALDLAPTARARQALLTKDNDFIFDYLNPPVEAAIVSGNAGTVVLANRNSFPALIGNGAAMALGTLSPCGFNTPHTHPRATELNIVVEGELMTSFIPENDARVVRNKVPTFSMAVFPQGAIHQEFNPKCVPARFVAAFPSEDPATLQVADNFFKLDNSVISAALGGAIDGAEIDRVRHLIPHNVAKGVDECLKACGIAKK